MPTPATKKLLECYDAKIIGQDEVLGYLHKILGAIPDDDFSGEAYLMAAWAPFKRGRGTEIEFQPGASDQYQFKDDKITIETRDDKLDMAYAVLFETYNASQRQKYQTLDGQYNTRKDMSFLEYGNEHSSIEAVTTMFFVRLMNFILRKNPETWLTPTVVKQLKSCAGCDSPESFIAIQLATPHSSSANDYLRMKSPEVSAFDACIKLSPIQAGDRLSSLVVRYCGQAKPPGLVNFSDWFRKQWRETIGPDNNNMERRMLLPWLWLRAGYQAADVFKDDLTRSIYTADLGFTYDMFQWAVYYRLLKGHDQNWPSFEGCGNDYVSCLEARRRAAWLLRKK